MLGRRSALALIVAAVAAPARALGEVRSEPLAEAFPLLGGYLALPQRQRTLFYLAYRAVRRGRLEVDVRAEIVTPGGLRREITFDRLGFVERPPTLAEIRNGGQAQFGIEPFRFQLEARAAIAPSSHLDPTSLARALAQLDGSVNQVVGGLGIFIPRLTAAFFPEGAAGRVRLADGSEAPLRLFKTPLDGSTPYFEPARYPEALEVVLEETPTRITLGTPRLLG